MGAKSCFVICPLGLPDSTIRRRSDRLLDLVIRPILNPLGYEVIRADLAADHPTIPDIISQHIFQDDLVIADLSDSNPNVFYELGKRHAWNAACIHLTDDIEGLPFDLRHYRVLEYDLDDPDKIEALRQELQAAIRAAEKYRAQLPFSLTPHDIVRLSGLTAVIQTASGRDNPYLVTKSIAEGVCTTMLLMQRSSSLILGPERGWGAEAAFYETILKRVREGVELLHVVSLEGIARHLARPQSTFPAVEEALLQLVDAKGLVAVQGRTKLMYIKKVNEAIDNEDLKPDRQARVFLVRQENGSTEGNFIIDIGSTQCSFHLKGPDVERFMSRALEFYHTQCEYLRWDELNAVLAPYRSV